MRYALVLYTAGNVIGRGTAVRGMGVFGTVWWFPGILPARLVLVQHIYTRGINPLISLPVLSVLQVQISSGEEECLHVQQCDPNCSGWESAARCVDLLRWVGLLEELIGYGSNRLN